jgi:hypothetical protein
VANSKANHCTNRMTSYNLDGRDFVNKLTDDGVYFDHAILNLPSIAIEFLDVFIGIGARRRKRFSRLKKFIDSLIIFNSPAIGPTPMARTSVLESMCIHFQMHQIRC